VGETDQIGWWLRQISRALQLQHPDTIALVERVGAMLPRVFAPGSDEHRTYHLLLQEIIGFIRLGDYESATVMFGYTAHGITQHHV